MTDLEKRIYNTHLKISKIYQNKPFRYRKDFDTLDESVVGVLFKLKLFFERYPHINLENFIEAPYKIWNDTFYPLDFYITRKALKVYTVYKKELLLMDVDSDDVLNKCIESIKYIQRFCKDKNISLNEYFNTDTDIFLIHLSKYYINVYTLFGFKDFKDVFFSKDLELRKMYLGLYYNDIECMYRNYMNSNKCKKIVEKGLTLIGYSL